LVVMAAYYRALRKKRQVNILIKRKIVAVLPE